MSQATTTVKVGDKVRIYSNGEHFLKTGKLMDIEVDTQTGVLDIPGQSYFVRVPIQELAKV